MDISLSSSWSDYAGIIVGTYISSAFNLGMRSLFVMGAIAVYKYVPVITRVCLLTGSILFAVCIFFTSPISNVVWVRTLSVSQYASVSIVIGMISNVSLFVFGIGFLQLCQKFARFELRHRHDR